VTSLEVTSLEQGPTSGEPGAVSKPVDVGFDWVWLDGEGGECSYMWFEYTGGWGARGCRRGNPRRWNSTLTNHAEGRDERKSFHEDMNNSRTHHHEKRDRITEAPGSVGQSLLIYVQVDSGCEWSFCPTCCALIYAYYGVLGLYHE